MKKAKQAACLPQKECNRKHQVEQLPQEETPPETQQAQLRQAAEGLQQGHKHEGGNEILHVAPPTSHQQPGRMP
jgi:hypothetical protein